MQDYILSRFNTFPLDTDGLTPENLPERTKKKFIYTSGSSTLVICLPGWSQPLWSWYFVKRHILRSGASFLAYDFPRPILSNNKELTQKCFAAINRMVREDISRFKQEHGFKKCVVATLSLSSSYGSMIYKDNSDVTDIILVAPGENLARGMWHGHRTQHLRKSYQKQGIGLPELEEDWHNMASEHNMPASGTRVSVHLGTADRVIPYQFARTLTGAFENAGLQARTNTYHFFGHYVVSYWFLLWPSKFLTF